jgi:hypothetical protein
MIKLEMPTKDIPVDPANLSPALASMVAQLITPNQYTRIMRDSVLSCNAKCGGVTRFIGK